MATLNIRKIGRCALWISPVIIVPVAFFAAAPWLAQQPDALTLSVAAAAALFVMAYSQFLAARVNRRLDEVQIAGQRIANTRGMTIGSVAAVIVMMIPSLMNGLAGLAMRLASGSPEEAVKLGITIGFMLVVVLQVVGAGAVSLWWSKQLKKSAD
ncbi:MAG TPA: hypothetical protein DEG76_08705 [Pseudohongiella sp.]|nr:hypothetical protein [Pseudohongiella sp.]HBX37343.1 hypothetical protein [Pseudohongiella sp.]|tara:strand:+ start:4214 stop:4678 length:465 start_codon:yes stop_codon:yes gene_type:complete